MKGFISTLATAGALAVVTALAPMPEAQAAQTAYEVLEGFGDVYVHHVLVRDEGYGTTLQVTVDTLYCGPYADLDADLFVSYTDATGGTVSTSFPLGLYEEDVTEYSLSTFIAHDGYINPITGYVNISVYGGCTPMY